MEALPVGVVKLDQMLHGGLERGTITIISGPSGVGKTTLGLQFMKTGAARGERSIVYTFEEEVEIVIQRSEMIGIPARKMVEEGTLSLTKVRPLQFTPDEFAHLVRRDVEDRGARVVMIDSVSGYKLSLHGADLVRRLHALCKFLQSIGVTVVLLAETQSIVGDFQATDVELSYLADNIVFLRYLEIEGELRKAIGVLKKRLSDFEKVLREFEITSNGIQVGDPMTELRGILSGVPTSVAAAPSESVA
jgi:circadian clock protein KaiC